METILVTGATGFLGKYVIKESEKENVKIIAIGRRENIGNSLKSDKTEFYKVDFSNIEELEKLFKSHKIDKVIHAGALSSAWGKWEDFYNSNVLGTENIAKMCLKYNIKRLVYISSPSVYTEKRDRLNIKEDEVNETNELNYYIKTKIMSEKLLQDYIEKGLYTVILRPRGLIGIGDPSLIPRLLNANSKIGIPIFNEGKNLVDITCVENVAYACVLALNTENIKGEVFNITNGEQAKFKDILENFLYAIDEKPKYLKLPFGLLYGVACITEKIFKTFNIEKEPTLTRYTVCTLGFSQTLNIEKAKEKLGYKPKITLEEGINAYGKWWKENKKN